ncbi:MAG: type II toxin-antitoxin system RelE/ParE family toxin [Acidobacteria bacterium]|nr:type II toxin-antitoxin system RelE/ParE family toxin [Acidobacteriota bacterium]
MARLVWTHRATSDLNEIADYIAFDNVGAAIRLVKRIYSHVEQLSRHPLSGPVPIELPDSEYRQLVEPPCRIFYRIEGDTVFIVHVMRSESILRLSRLGDLE